MIYVLNFYRRLPCVTENCVNSTMFMDKDSAMARAYGDPSDERPRTLSTWDFSGHAPKFIETKQLHDHLVVYPSLR